MREIKFVDTTLRDGQSCVWGYRMTTGMILPIAARMDAAGFEAIEADSYNTMKMRVLQEKEDPWARIRLLARAVTKTPLMIYGGPSFGSFSQHYLAIAELRDRRLAANGIRRVQVTGFMNDLKFKIPKIVGYSHAAGLEVLLGLVYAISPRHTDDYYATKAAEALALKPDRIYLKDPIGLLTPERIRTVIPAIQRNCGNVPLELHSHCTTGLAPLCYLEAVKLGVSIIHTGIPPLANSAAQPSVLNMASNIRLLGYSPRVDEAVVKEIGDHFSVIAKAEGLPIGVPVEYDVSQHLHQVPGGVISNLKRQLTELGIGRRLGEVLQETARVRQDLGYPIMYTPFSQFVVTQAAINMVIGERYREVTDEMLKYVLGFWGDETASGVETEVKGKILDRPRAKELAREKGFEPTIGEIRQKLGGPGVSDDDLLMRCLMGGAEQLKGLHSSIVAYPFTRTPLAYVLRQLLAQKNYPHYVRVEKGEMKLVLQKTTSSGHSKS